VTRTWRMFAGGSSIESRPFQRFGDERTVRFCGLEPVAVELTEDPQGDHYGWLRAGADASVMIQGCEGIFRIQSPDGFRSDVERGRGEIVRMSCRVVQG
jgi:hypothetical protein